MLSDVGVWGVDISFAWLLSVVVWKLEVWEGDREIDGGDCDCGMVVRLSSLSLICEI